MAKIELIHDKLSLKDLEVFEREHNLKFPDLYREFLLNYNGGYVNPNVFSISSEEGESALNVFYGIGNMHNNLEKKFNFFDEILEIGFIPIASDSGGNQICLGINESFYEKIYCWDHEQETDESMENMYFLADNINDFLDGLYESK
ncbi:SMI1/KNR4 family protein [Bacillus pseudomycoides]|uniref:SMI1/KNR4 family protein n=1 Tax=Bacillus pseudomycoides TaxID=64104 RepID=UPI000BEC563B|nr:SMI1/KNR4 family protein [Bacillus pseudomycoides]MED4651219.1 SMI1/KNR4 family protein [Bacillus pseudomycoides]PEE07135.1 SMI1/KNR4 family protein [Bacillus pseudomycoides]PEM77876.1 SMI1/KNR4 family protein [Bacillus pseudomycoides]PHC83721.1 SMI1/KNR4 family protein [Bacillus pseudomycoides]